MKAFKAKSKDITGFAKQSTAVLLILTCLHTAQANPWSRFNKERLKDIGYTLVIGAAGLIPSIIVFTAAFNSPPGHENHANHYWGRHPFYDNHHHHGHIRKVK
jgi:hypothetical protein